MTVTNNDLRHLPTGTLAVSKGDGEPGHVAQVCTFRRSGRGAYSYVIDTAYGREVWMVDDLFVPDSEV